MYQPISIILSILSFLLSLSIAIHSLWERRINCRIIDATISSLLYPGNYKAIVLSLVVHNASRKPLQVGGASLSTTLQGEASSWHCAWDRRFEVSPPQGKRARRDFHALQQELDASTFPPQVLAPWGTTRISFLFRTHSSNQLTSDLHHCSQVLQQWHSEHKQVSQTHDQSDICPRIVPDPQFLPLSGFLSLNGQSRPFHIQARYIEL